jgi:hypothetical protein
MRVLSGLLMFVFGGILFAAGVIGLTAAVLSSPMMDALGKLGTLDVSLWPAVLLAILFFILFLAGVFLMKVALQRKEG